MSGHHCLHLSYLIGLESFCRLAIIGASDVADCFGVVGVDSVGGVAGGFASGVASGGRCAQWKRGPSHRVLRKRARCCRSAMRGGDSVA